MSNIYEISKFALTNLQDRLASSALNAANATTPGYRRRLISQQPVFLRALASAESPPNTSESHARNFASDTTAGPLRKTNLPTDVALTQPGAFFLVSDGTRQLITRAGNFQISHDGFLTSSLGHRVQSSSGDIAVPPGALSIDERGTVIVNGQRVASLLIVAPSDIASLAFSENGLEAKPDAISPFPESGAILRPGFVEDSNGDHTSEMIALMSTVRQYESMIRATQGYDDMLSRTIQKLGDIQG